MCGSIVILNGLFLLAKCVTDHCFAGTALALLLSDWLALNLGA